MKKFLLSLFLLAASAGFSSCEYDHDDYSLHDTLVGRVWAGDLGFYQNGQIPLDSYVYFGADGFGTDELHYADNGQFLDRLHIQWNTYRDDTIYINYGNVDYPRELRRVSIRGGRIYADLYIGGQWYGDVVLYMQ